jgi:DNA-binding transcriptional MerR regulator/methylmalonyl-CoA mutase cobalamin-binding subunit
LFDKAYLLPVTDSPDSQTSRYPVRLVSLRTGLTPHVLRAWERRYRVVTPSRTDGGQRLYSEVDVERLTLLRRLTERGHGIGRLASLGLDELVKLDEASASEATPGSPFEARRARSFDGGAHEVTEAALRAVQRLDAVELQAILERAAVTLGVPDFLDRVVGVVLEEIGQGWQARSVSVAQEHLATGVVRRVLGWLLGVYEVNGVAPRLVVATPPGQVHELGALMVAVSAAAEGWAVTYLGPDLPVTDLVSAVAQTGARAVAISVVYVPDDRDVAAALRETRASLPARVPLLLGGRAAAAILAEHEVAGLMVINSLPELRTQLRRMSGDET